MNETVEAVKELVAVVALQRVRVVKADIGTIVADVDEIKAPAFLMKHATAAAERSGTEVGISVVFELKVVDESELPSSAKKLALKQLNPKAWINASFELVYSVPDGHVFGDSALRVFAAINGVYNAWPFVREFVQSSLTRMNLPPVPIPLYRLPDLAQAEKIARRTSGSKGRGVTQRPQRRRKSGRGAV